MADFLSNATPVEPWPAEDFVTLRVPAGAEAASRSAAARASDAARGDVVLARRDAPLRPHTLVVARGAAGYEMRRVGRVTDEMVELLPLDEAGAPLRLRHDARDLVGTVVLRWHDDVV